MWCDVDCPAVMSLLVHTRVSEWLLLCVSPIRSTRRHRDEHVGGGRPALSRPRDEQEGAAEGLRHLGRGAVRQGRHLEGEDGDGTTVDAWFLVREMYADELMRMDRSVLGRS